MVHYHLARLKQSKTSVFLYEVCSVFNFIFVPVSPFLLQTMVLAFNQVYFSDRWKILVITSCEGRGTGMFCVKMLWKGEGVINITLVGVGGGLKTAIMVEVKPLDKALFFLYN